MRPWLLAASCLTAVLWGSGTAAACGNAVWHEVTQRKLPAHLKQAEQLLQDGKYYEVTALINYSYKGIPDAAPLPPQKNSLETRRRRLVAKAMLALGHPDPAIRLLKPALAQDQQSPQLRAEYSEALAQRGGRAARRQARKILEELFARDLIPEARHHRVLADLRAADNDKAGSVQALARCAAMAASNVCPELRAPVRSPIATAIPPLECAGSGCPPNTGPTRSRELAGASSLRELLKQPNKSPTEPSPQ